jgi:hypothetical protein
VTAGLQVLSVEVEASLNTLANYQVGTVNARVCVEELCNRCCCCCCCCYMPAGACCLGNSCLPKRQPLASWLVDNGIPYVLC